MSPPGAQVPYWCPTRTLYGIFLPVVSVHIALRGTGGHRGHRTGTRTFLFVLVTPKRYFPQLDAEPSVRAVAPLPFAAELFEPVGDEVPVELLLSRLLGLRVTLDADGMLAFEGRFDADLMRLTPEVEAWVAGLREIDERMRGEHAADQTEALDKLEGELAVLQRHLSLRATQATSG